MAAKKKNVIDRLNGGSPDPGAASRGNRVAALVAAHYNPMRLPADAIEFDLKTDSWAQLALPAIDRRMRALRDRMQEPVDADACVRSVFPFAHFVFTESGRTAEQALYRAWARKGIVCQNLMFPTNIAHQIGNDFRPKELPARAFFELAADVPGKADIDLAGLREVLEKSPTQVAMVCIELSDNAAGGQPVSVEHLREVRSLLAPHAIPLVLDATRILENARFNSVRPNSARIDGAGAADAAQPGLFDAVHALLACADTVVASLPKDFCIDKGGLIATNDSALYRAAHDAADKAGTALDPLDRRLIALSMRDRRFLEASLDARMQAAQRVWRVLEARGVPVVAPVGGHCVLVDVGRMPAFSRLETPVASFLAWLYMETGIRAAAHNAGMRRRPETSGLVRIALPMGLDVAQIDIIVARLDASFARSTNIPELVMSNQPSAAFGEMNTEYALKAVPDDAPGSAAHPSGGAAGQEDAQACADTPDTSGVPDASPTVVEDAGDRASDPATVEAPAVVGGVEAPATAERRVFDIAVVGMAGRYPKARNVDELWQNLRSGRDCIEELPQARYEQRLRYGPAARYRGGFIDDVDKFDSLFFNIPPKDAERLDPQERLFVEVAWETLEDAGYYPESIGSTAAADRVGVYVGAVWAMYQTLGVEEKHCGESQAPNSFLWSIANRVSYAMNLSGPSLTVDTACSSSLTALYLACEAIYAGECGSAIVGGVNLDLHQSKWDINWSGGALSKDGVCRSFGHGANGYVAGEGVGAVYIKPLARALEDGDRIYGVIKSVVVNHGGRTSGFVVPNPKAQTNLVREAIQRACVPAASIGYIEAHGTGTELGDPLEVSALDNAFRDSGIERRGCALGSLKSNIGHLEAAAGVASLTKILLQMRHGQLVPSLHSAELNEHIDFEKSFFQVQQRLEPWIPREIDGVPQPLRAGISSFGAGGSNAHVIVESWMSPPKAQAPSATVHILPFSARTETQLADVARRLLDFLASEATLPPLGDIAFTLQSGRKPFDHRAAVLARSPQEACERLTAFLAGKRNEGVFSGNVKNADPITRLMSRSEREEVIGLLSRRRDPAKFAKLWVDGMFSEWRGTQGAAVGGRVSLPTYPFADKRHWVPVPAANPAAALPMRAGLHPLLDSNESTFERQVFRKSFNAREFFIYDHLVMDVPTLPGVAYLELARKAGELAADRPVRKLHNIVWVSPIAVKQGEPADAWIELKPASDGVRFEVYGEVAGQKTLHSQGRISYGAEAPADERLDLVAIQARCEKAIEGRDAYPLFKSFGLDLGPSFQSLQEVYRGEGETLGRLKLPESRLGDLASMLLHPSLVDGSLQAGVAAQLGDSSGNMLVPFSIGEVEVLHPLPADCWSYVTEMKNERAEQSRVSRKNVTILDATGKVLVRIKEATGVPIAEVHKPAAQGETSAFAKLFYAPEWRAAPIELAPAGGDAIDRVVFFDDDATLRDTFRGAAGAGRPDQRFVLAAPADAFAAAAPDRIAFDPARQADYDQVIASTVVEGGIDKLCIAWPLHDDAFDDARRDERIERSAHAALAVCRALANAKLDRRVQLLFAYPVVDATAPAEYEAIAGLFRAMHLEFPKVRCRAVGIERADADTGRVAALLRTEFGDDAADAVSVRHLDGAREVRSLKAYPLQPHAEAASAEHLPREGGVYLITGGAGGLGLIFAEYLATHYRARLVLTGRSAQNEAIAAACERVRACGGEALYVAADVCDAQSLRQAVDQAHAHFGGINGVIHSAGVLRDSFIRNKTREDFDAVLAPKIRGTHNLDAATADDPLDFFVLFSSMAAVAGNAGQADYGYANHYMDSFAFARERLRAAGARRGKTLSLNWSLWADGGMRVDEQTEQMFTKTLGLKLLATDTGTAAMIDALASDATQLAVLEGIQEKIETAWGLRKKPAAPAPAASDASGAAGAASPAGGHAASVQAELTRIAMEFLKLDEADISPDSVLLDLGFDSIGLTTYANEINSVYGVDVTPVLFFDYPSIQEVAKYLAAERSEEVARVHGGKTVAVSPAATGSAAVSAAPQADDAGIRFGKGWDPLAIEAPRAQPSVEFRPVNRFVDMPIAIVGMSGTMPQSDDLDEFWEHLRNGDDLISVIPRDRWNWEEFYGDPFKEANKSNSKWGGFMKEVDKFDALFFGISRREAQMMDPQQRIFLETVWKAIEDSGHRVSDFSGTRTGLFVGAATNDYVDLMNRLDIDLDGYSASGNSHSVLANRISFLLNLRGPSAPIDTACSSSLVALHRAIESIHTGSCEMAIVGGVQVMLSPAAYISFGMAGMLSNDGKCKSFDKRADGYVRGEGSGAIVLKPLHKAEADGDHIYAVIRATAENHGGKVTTLTAPNSAAQAELLIEAYEKAHVDPARVGYIECHGTGTSLGDPIEIQALTKAFGELYKRSGKPADGTAHCGLSSAKTNIGHLETAAGIAGILRVLLAIKHRQIPANVHFEELNPYIKLSGTPFYIVDKTRDWAAPVSADGRATPRLAGVSSFGFGGANAHVVLEEYVPQPRSAAANGADAGDAQVIVLSAKAVDRLQAYAASMLAALETQALDLEDFAYTLQVGRDEMAERLAFVAHDVREAREKLARYLRGELGNDIFTGSVRGSKKTADADAPAAQAGQDEHSELASRWVRGAQVDWTRSNRRRPPLRLSLPTYPFARERCWIPGVDEQQTKAPPSKLPAPASASVKATALSAAASATARSPKHEVSPETLFFLPKWVGSQAAKRLAADRKTGAVVLFVRDAAHASRLSDRFVRAGLSSPTIVTVLPGEAFRRESSVSYVLRRDQQRDYASLFDGLSESGLDIGEVVFAWSQPGNVSEAVPQAQASHRSVSALLLLVQALASRRGKEGGAGQSQGAVRLFNLYAEGADWQLPQDAAIGTFFQSLSLETRGIRFFSIDLMGEDGSAQRDEALCDGIFSCLVDLEPGQIEGRLAGAEYFERRFEVQTAPGSDATLVRERGVYVITGGVGGLGLIFANYLASRAKAGLVLLGRSDLDPDRSAALDALRSSGSRVLYMRCDVSDQDDVSRAMAHARAEFGRIDGVIHAAGAIHDAPFTEKTLADMEATFATKIRGTLNVDAATADDDLDFFTMFSSIASVLGSAGQCDYAYANGFLDRFSELRRQRVQHGLRHGKTLSIGWPLWQDGGMRPEKIKGVHLDEQARAYWQSHTGIYELDTASGLQAFEACLQLDAPAVTVLHGDRAKLMSMMGLSVPAARNAAQTQRPGQAGTVTLAGTALADHLENDLLQILSDVLLISRERIRRDALLSEYGLDSIGVANLIRTVNERYSLDLAPALLFEYPTYEALSAHLLDAYRDTLSAHYAEALGAAVDGPDVVDPASATDPNTPMEGAAAPESVASLAASRAPGSADVAVVGISATMPGADSAAAFWRNLIAGVDPITEVPAERWDWRGSGEGAALPRGVRWGGFVADVDKFDAGFFEIAPSEAALMDPQQRLFLQSAWNAIEDAGHRVADLAGTRTGVFVGLSGFDYSEAIRASGIGSVAQSATGMAHCLLPNRLSYLLDLRGPSEAIDTACSSSLVAVHRAVEAIAGGDCEMAIAGGVNLMLAPSLQSALGHAGMLAGDGRCKTFDRNADGYVRSEGCAAVLLKRLDRAVADGDEIYGVVKGSAVNHGGRAMGLTAPNPNAQAEVVAEAYRRAGVDAAQVGLIETHGTGTPMGDAVELNGLRKAFGELASRAGADVALAASRDCMVSSVKTSIGHLEAASGIASLIKVLLSIRHRTIPGLLHFTELSPQIRLDGTRFRIARDTRAWQAFEGPAGDRLPLTAGVSSFGFGGVNAHVVVQEHAPVQHANGATADRGLSRLIVLSAKTREQLRQRAAALAGYLDADAAAEGVDLARIAYTLQTGRDGMAHRLGLRAASLEELSKALHAFAADGRVPAGGHCGEPERTSESMSSIDRDPQLKRMIVDKWIENGDHGAILELWSRGVDIDWNGLYGDRRPRRVHLPGYPFARSRHWVDTFHASTAGSAAQDPHAPTPADASPAAQRPAIPSAPAAVQMPATTPKALAVRFIRRALSQQLQVPPESLPLDRTLLEMGVVSSGIASLVRQVNTTLDLDLVPSLMFEHPTIDGFATHLSGIAADALLRNAAPDEAAQSPAVVAEAMRQDVDDQEALHVLQDRDLIDKVLWKQDANDEDYERVTF